MFLMVGQMNYNFRKNDCENLSQATSTPGKFYWPASQTYRLIGVASGARSNSRLIGPLFFHASLGGELPSKRSGCKCRGVVSGTRRSPCPCARVSITLHVMESL